MTSAILGRATRGLLVASAGALLLLGVRAGLVRDQRFLFLAWNLALAWVPLACAVLCVHLAARPGARRAWAWLTALAWLLFLPNAPYLLTDLIHVIRGAGATTWLDLYVTLSFGVLGLGLGHASLGLMAREVTRRIGRVGAWGFILAVLWLTSIGVYAGRYHRWNSWDLLHSPVLVLADLLQGLLTPWTDRRGLGFAATHFAFLLVTYTAAHALAQLWSTREAGRDAAGAGALGTREDDDDELWWC